MNNYKNLKLVSDNVVNAKANAQGLNVGIFAFCLLVWLYGDLHLIKSSGVHPIFLFQIQYNANSFTNVVGCAWVLWEGLHRRRKSVGSIPVGRPIVDSFFATAPDLNLSCVRFLLKIKTLWTFRIYLTLSEVWQNHNRYSLMFCAWSLFL